jgi:hypothetical protein
MSDKSAKVVDALIETVLQFAVHPSIELLSGARTDVLDYIAALEAERDALRDSWRLIPCTERLPAQGVRVLVDINGTVKIAKLWKVRPQWETDDGLYYHGDNFSFVTGWLPLPEPPADGG